MGGSAPKTPDPVKTAAAQTSQNVDTAVANAYLGNVNQYTPYGSRTYDQSGTYSWTDPSGKTYNIPRFSMTETLDPRQQALQNEQTRAGTNTARLAADQSARLSGILGKPMNFNGAPQVGDPKFDTVDNGPALKLGFNGGGNIASTFGDAGKITRSYGDPQGYADQRQKVEDALMARMNPQLKQDQQALQSRLANQGLAPGSQAYNDAYDAFTRQSNDARMGAILGAGEEQSRLAGLDQQRAQFQNSAQQQAYEQAYGRGQFANQAQAQRFGQNATQAGFYNDALQQRYQNAIQGQQFNNDVRQQIFNNQNGQRANWFNEQYAARNQPINEIAALLGTGGVQQPNFSAQGGGGIANTDIAGLQQQAYANRMAGYNSRQQMMGGLFSSLGQAAGSAMMLSDARLKHSLKALGTVDDLPLYEFSYIGETDRRVGFLAQDVAEKFPDAVMETPSGYLAVDYGRWL